MKQLSALILEARAVPTSIKFPGSQDPDLSEIGDSSVKAFPYRITLASEEMFEAEFTTGKGTRYSVLMHSISARHEPPVYEAEYRTVGSSYTGHPYKDVINKGELYRVMATVVQVFTDIVDKNLDKIYQIEFSGTSKTGESDNESTTQRTKLYKQYLKHNDLVKKYFQVDLKGSNRVVLTNRAYKGIADEGKNGVLSLVKTLLEIGDASSSPYKTVDRGMVHEDGHFAYLWEFSTDLGTEYRVILKKEHIEQEEEDRMSAYEISFSARLPREGGDTDFTYTSAVNKGEMFRVMSTISNVVSEFFSKNKDNILFFTYSATDNWKSGEGYKGSNAKDKLYRAYLQRSPFGSDIKVIQNGELTVLLNNNIEGAKDAFIKWNRGY